LRVRKRIVAGVAFSVSHCLIEGCRPGVGWATTFGKLARCASRALGRLGKLDTADLSSGSTDRQDQYEQEIAELGHFG